MWSPDTLRKRSSTNWIGDLRILSLRLVVGPTKTVPLRIQLSSPWLLAVHPRPPVNTVQVTIVWRLVRMASGRPIAPAALETTLLYLGTVQCTIMNFRLWGIVSEIIVVTVDVDVSHLDSLGSTGLGVPSIVTATKSPLSFSCSYDSQLDRIINNSVLQDFESPALPCSPPHAPDTGGTVNWHRRTP